MAIVYYNTEDKTLLKKAFGYDNVAVYEAEEVKVLGALGHAIFMPFKFEKKTYEEKTENGKRRLTVPEMYIPTAIIECSRTKNMEMTAVDGKNGTVKEYGSHGDYLVTIKGILISNDGKYPEKDKKHLAAFEECPESVPVACDILSWLGIYEVVIERINWVAMPGYENVQAFELSCVQDTHFLAKLNGEV